jgi:hypothetical protein
MKKNAAKASGKGKKAGLKDLPMKKGDEMLKGGRVPTHANVIIKSGSR